MSILDLDAAVERLARERGVDPALLRAAALREAEQVARHPLELLDDDDVAAQWVARLGGFWSAAAVADRLGVTKQAVSKHPDLLALRTGNRRVVYPRMQFHRGKPAPGMSAVLDAVPASIVDRWSLAGWLVAPNRLIDGERPIDVLHDGRRGRVIEIARRLAARASA